MADRERNAAAAAAKKKQRDERRDERQQRVKQSAAEWLAEYERAQQQALDDKSYRLSSEKTERNDRCR